MQLISFYALHSLSLALSLSLSLSLSLYLSLSPDYDEGHQLIYLKSILIESFEVPILWKKEITQMLWIKAILIVSNVSLFCALKRKIELYGTIWN